MTMRDRDRIRRFLASELDRLVEEFREAESENESLAELYDVANREEFMWEDHTFEFIVALTYQKNCSLLVATAAVYAFWLLYPTHDIVLPDVPKN